MPRVKSSLVDDIFNLILERINNYSYITGDSISEISLAEELHISRTPVREALLKLIDFGLLTKEKSKVVVKSLNLYDIKEILDARLAIELMSVRLLNIRGGLTPGESKSFKEFYEQFSKSIDDNNIEKFFMYDMEFHKMIISFSQNSRLIEFAQKLDIQSQRFRKITILTPGRHKTADKEHADIVKAFSENNTELLNEMLTHHTEYSKKNYEEILTNDTWSKMIKSLRV